jgi:hypothetical protein
MPPSSRHSLHPQKPVNPESPWYTLSVYSIPSSVWTRQVIKFSSGIGYNGGMDDQPQAADLEAYAEKLRRQIDEYQTLIEDAKKHLANVAEHLRQIQDADRKLW